MCGSADDPQILACTKHVNVTAAHGGVRLCAGLPFKSSFPPLSVGSRPVFGLGVGGFSTC